jgi:uncharacterized protein YjbI with pentapeptide repeats
MGAIGWFVLLFSFLGLAAIVLVPQAIIPNSRSSKYDEILRVATTRNSIRATIAQIVAGLAFVATFIQGSVNFNLDSKQKSDLAAADQFSKAFSQLKDSSDNTWAMIGNFYILANIAESDNRYHESVFGALAQFIVEHSGAECASREVSNLKKEKLTTRDYHDPAYAISPLLNTASRLFVDRAKDKSTQRKFSLEGACLANADFYAASGLSWLFMPHVKLLRANATNAVITDSDLRGIEAGVVHNLNWKDYEDIGSWKLHHELPAEITAKLRANFENAELRNDVLNGAGLEGANFYNAKLLDSSMVGTNFKLADLTNADFSGSDLRSATLDGANIASTDFTKAKNLTIEQLKSACVRGRYDTTGNEKSIGSILPSLPPYLTKTDVAGITLCK